jgi:hypothetical protein
MTAQARRPPPAAQRRDGTIAAPDRLQAVRHRSAAIMRNLQFVLLAAVPVIFLLLGPGCSLDPGMSGSAISESVPVHFAGDGLEASADQRM